MKKHPGHLTYLASPYSHPDPAVREGRYRAACAVAAILSARGDLVFSPVSHGHGIGLSGRLPVSWEYWQRLDLRMLASCDSRPPDVGPSQSVRSVGAGGGVSDLEAQAKT